MQLEWQADKLMVHTGTTAKVVDLRITNTSHNVNM